MPQLFSTELVPVSDRVDAWQWNAQQICGDCRIELPRASLHGSIEIREIGALKLTRFSSSPLSFRKWPVDAVASENQSCIVITQLQGFRRYVQNGSDVWLQAGDSTVIDSSRPWSSSCGTECVRLYFRVPRWMMEARLQTRKIPIVCKISGCSRAGAALARLSKSLYDQPERTEEEEAAALNGYFETLTGCLGLGGISKQHTQDLRARIRHFVDARLSDSSLAPAEVASAMGISLRHLHRVFSATGKTFGDYLRARRLENCLRDLANPRLTHKSITEVAFSWGFSDAEHFSHSFRKQFGVSPRAFRAGSPQATGFRNYVADHVSPLRYDQLN
jgi:AraC-like DNA-binding protein